MEEGKYYRHEVFIEATPEDIWEAFTTPEYTKEFLFGCELISDWNIGSSIQWKGSEDGLIYAQGIIVTFETNKQLAFTVYDPEGKYNDAPENHLIATFTIDEKEEGCLLKIAQGDYSKVESGDVRLKQSSGWVAVFQDLKQLLESD